MHSDAHFVRDKTTVTCAMLRGAVRKAFFLNCILHLLNYHNFLLSAYIEQRL
jgi:hypothetical protein